MKKNIRTVMVVAAVALVAGINVFNSRKSDVLSDVALVNVEALADEEWYDGNCFWSDWQYTYCYPQGQVPYHCPCGAIGL